MYNNLVLYRNELKNRSIPKYKVVGIVSELLFSKEIFTKNKEINEFLKQVFDIEFKAYVLKSRALVVAHTSRMILLTNDKNLYKHKLINFINQQIDTIKENEGIKEKRNSLDGWMK